VPAFQTVWAFLLVLGVLIFVHELGHFLVARWFGVRVLTFSLGFGPKILKWTRGGTVYCVSAIPLGGYVKMAGETTQDERVGASDEFMSKSRWVRFLVYLAGPAMNVLLAVVALTIVLANGADVPVYNSAPAVIGALDDKSVAASAGMQLGDRIVAVDGREVATWDDMSMAVLPKANKSIDVVIDRNGQRQTISVVPASETKYEFGTLGIGPIQRPQVVDVTAGRPAEKAGFQRGDIVVAIEGQRSPARKDIIDILEKSTDKPVRFDVERNGATVTLAVTPEGTPGKIGVTISPVEVKRVDPTITEAFGLSVTQNWDATLQIGRTLRDLFTGDTPVKQLMGPVAIAELSGSAASLGWLALLGLMASISLNLALLNLMPVPVLDGGQMTILMMEGLFRRDLSMKWKEGFAIAGALMIVTLMVTVLYNDIARVLR
jgi:regulator of sigma E protease